MITDSKCHQFLDLPLQRWTCDHQQANKTSVDTLAQNAAPNKYPAQLYHSMAEVARPTKESREPLLQQALVSSISTTDRTSLTSVVRGAFTVSTCDHTHSHQDIPLNHPISYHLTSPLQPFYGRLPVPVLQLHSANQSLPHDISSVWIKSIPVRHYSARSIRPSLSAAIRHLSPFTSAEYPDQSQCGKLHARSFTSDVFVRTNTIYNHTATPKCNQDGVIQSPCNLTTARHPPIHFANPGLDVDLCQPPVVLALNSRP